MLPFKLRNKIEIVGSENQIQRQIRLYQDSGKRGMHRRVYFTKELDRIIPSQDKRCDRLNVFKRELKDYILNIMRHV